jgi:hypothetical protein
MQRIKMQRFRLEQDDDSHWYAIPADKTPAFTHWVDSFNDSAEGDFSEGDFNQYRLNMHPSNYTFMDLQEDR